MFPVHAPDYYPFNHRVVFLAGPIQGAPDWQAEAMRLLRPILGGIDVSVCSPRRLGAFPEGAYEQQVDWERFHLREAAGDGVTMFWLAKEVEHDCKRSYAQTTRFELAEALTKHVMGYGGHIVLGIEDGFTGAKYIRKYVADHCPGIQIHTTLEATCKAVGKFFKET